MISRAALSGLLISASLAVCAEPIVPEEQLPSIEANSRSSARLRAADDPTASEEVARPAAPASQHTSGFLRTICQEIRWAAAVHNLPANFLTRLIWQESRFDPRAVSRAGAQGIAQFMPATARWRGLTDPFDPHLSVREFARWLGELRGQFGNLGLAAAAYNAGPKRVKEWLDGNRGLPPETRAYVHVVTEQAAEEWARPGVRDDTSLLYAPPDCRIQELVRTVALWRIGSAQKTSKLLGERQEPASKGFAWSLQLIGDRSEEKALTEYRTLQKKFPAILGARPPLVIKKRLGGRGLAVWYQVRVAERSRDAANAICSRLRSVGGECLVLSSN